MSCRGLRSQICTAFLPLRICVAAPCDSEQQEHAAAEAEYRAVLAVEERVLGPEHSNTLSMRGNRVVPTFNSTDTLASFHSCRHSTSPWIVLRRLLWRLRRMCIYCGGDAMPRTC